MKEALHKFKENLTITLESLKAENKKNYEDKDKGYTILNILILEQ